MNPTLSDTMTHPWLDLGVYPEAIPIIQIVPVHAQSGPIAQWKFDEGAAIADRPTSRLKHARLSRDIIWGL